LQIFSRELCVASGGPEIITAGIVPIFTFEGKIGTEMGKQIMK